MSDLHIVKNNAEEFEATINIRQGERVRTTGKGSWNYELAAVINSGVVNDSALVLVDGRHIEGPHGETPLAESFGPGGEIVGAVAAALCLYVIIDADQYDEGVHTVKATPKVKKHPIAVGQFHYDYWTLEVEFEVSSKLFADSITSLSARIVASHDQNESEILEPENPPLTLDDDEADAIVEKYKEWLNSLKKDERE